MRMFSIRKIIFEEVAKYATNAVDPRIEVLTTTTSLLAYAGMHHVRIIDEFLAANPHALHIPMLQASINSYIASLKELRNVPDHLRPYYKLIWADQTRIFNRRDMQNLLVVAVSEAAKTQPRLRRYDLPYNSSMILSTWDSQVAAYRTTSKTRPRRIIMMDYL